MLPGSMYPKKTYGKSLFIGEFKHAVASVDAKNENSSSLEKKEDKTESSLDEQLPNEDANDTEEVNVSRTLTYEVQEEEEKSKNEEVKLIWKNSSGLPSTAKTSKGLATKAFFTPTTGENQTNDTEQVVDLPVIKEEGAIDIEMANKAVKKKRMSITGATVGNKKFLRPQKFTNLTKNKAVLIDSKKGYAQKSATDAEQIKTQSKPEPRSVKEGKEEAEDGVSDNEIPPENQEKAGHTEFSTKDYSSPDPKTIIIKAVDFSGYADKLREDGDMNSDSMLLEPNVVADMKRDLAEKGIIAFPPDLPQQYHSQATDEGEAEVPDPLSDSRDVYNGSDEERSNSELASDEDDSDMGAALEQSSDLAGDKLDRNKEGFKTNKSFEIRRLQAKAEREKEKKKRAIFGSRFSKIKARSDHLSRAPDHLAKLPLRSALKPATPPGNEDPTNINLKDSTSRQLKSRASVRIRDPEYDYQEYTDVELESDSGDSIRPNTSLSYEDLSIPSDVSSDSSSLGTSAGDEAFRDLPYSDEEHSSSYDDSEIHQLYDELDNFSPSRVGNYAGLRDGKSRDSRRDRVESSTSRATARSSLHLMVSDPQYSYHQQAAFLRGYNEKPLHLFDAMRHDRFVHSSESKRQKVKNNKRASEKDGGRKEDRPNLKHKETLPLAIVNEKNNQTRSYQHQAATKQNPIPLELDSAAYPVNGDAKKASKHKNWKERVEKFFETSYVNRKLSKKSTNTSNSQDSQTEKLKRFFCYFNWFDCQEMTFTRHLLCVAIPTIIITAGILIIILFTTNIVFTT